MDYMILDSTGNALGAYEDEIEAHAALREIAEAEPAAADVALLAYVDGMPVGEAVTPADLPDATSTIDLSQWTIALGFTRGITGSMPDCFSVAFEARAGRLTGAGVAAAPDWEERLADLEAAGR